MEYFLGYLIISFLYSLYFMYRLGDLEVKSITLIMAGTAFPLHILMSILSVFYRIFGVNIYYQMSFRVKESEEKWT